MGGFWASIGYGTALFWAAFFAALAVVSIVVVLMIRHYRITKLLSKPVLRMQQNPPNSDSQLEEIEQMLEDTGYAYDPEQNIYYSVMNPWQREMGYCSLYDEWSTPLGLVFDCEPVRFKYQGERWLIEFWKGQYGITVGGEIGVYKTAEPDLDIPGFFNGAFYNSVSDDELLDMTFVLRKKNQLMFSRADRHWWLTGFVLGEYSDPSQLTMEAAVTLRDKEMRDLFMASLSDLGYKDEEIYYSGNTVQFTFAQPHSKQPSMRLGQISNLTLRRNQGFVAKYKEMTKGQTNMYDILTTLKAESPFLYYLAIDAGRQMELFKPYKEIRKRLT